MRSASSAGANCRAACRAQSRAAFLARLAIVEEEADEPAFWLEMLRDLQLGDSDTVHRLHDEADQLTIITVASRKTARRDT